MSQVREGRRHRELTRLICVCRSLELVCGELVNRNLFAVVNQTHYTSRLSRPVSSSSGGGYSGGSSSGGGASSSWAVPNNSRFEIISDGEEEEKGGQPKK